MKTVAPVRFRCLALLALLALFREQASAGVTIAGTAANGTDYTTLTGTVTIPAKKKTATIFVTPIDDADLEQPETVEMVILPTANYTHSKRSKAKLTIIDND